MIRLEREKRLVGCPVARTATDRPYRSELDVAHEGSRQFVDRNPRLDILEIRHRQSPAQPARLLDDDVRSLRNNLTPMLDRGRVWVRHDYPLVWCIEIGGDHDLLTG